MRRLILIVVPLLAAGVGTAAGAVPGQTPQDPTTETTVVEPPVVPAITSQDKQAARTAGAAAALEIRRRIAAISSERLDAAVDIRDDLG
ncbi:MAG: hypothetical protein ACC652_01510, partial [Acidimicrobiales bacterium]